MAANLFTIAPGTSFVDALAAGLLERHRDQPERLGETLILVPTRRASRALQEAFVRQSDGAALILPSMQPLGDVDEDDLIADLLEMGEEAIDLPPAIPALQRQLLLTSLVRGAGAQVGAGNDEQAARLARDLAHLLDEVETAELDFDALDGLVEGDLARHWQTTLAFLRIITEQWPRILNERGLVDPAQRRSALIDALAARWSQNPPSTPVIAAGSTGTIPATARLMATILDLPEGAVVLPGLDRHLSAETWAAIDDTHPQAAIKALLDHVERTPADVANWPHSDAAEVPRGDPSRQALLSDAMLPATATTAWQRLEPAADNVFDGLSLIVCAHQREEAQVTALIMRHALLTPGKTAALVTRDRGLARRTAAELKRWGIEVDDSAGMPLAESVPGTFLRLIAEVAVERAAPIPLLALLKHPLAALGREPAHLRNQIRQIERLALRGPRPGSGLSGLRDALTRRPVDADLVALIDDMAEAFAALEAALANRRGSLSEMVKAHVACAEHLAARDNATGADVLWAGDAGEEAHKFVQELLDQAGILSGADGNTYAGLFTTLMHGHVVRPRFGRHPRLFIWGPLEARMQHADLVLIGGLSEGSWPPEIPADPWMSRPMRAAFGLPPQERRIGQAAHDFAQAAAGAEVVMLRSDKIAGSPAVPARWLMRLETLLDAWGKRHLLDQNAGQWRARAALIDRPALIEPAKPPQPAPPVADRPRRLSVTQVDTWLRDPYAIYARFVLGLQALDPLDEDPAAAERGTFVHEALDRFVKAWPDALPDDALDQLLAIGRDVLGPTLRQPAVAGFWWPRFERAAAWFIEREHERRHDLTAIVTESKAELGLDAPGGSFTLSAKADRLERRADGTVGVIDYKTGTAPSTTLLKAGGAPQLPLEAAMIREGAFDALPERTIAALEHWQLQGGDPPGQIKRLAGSDADDLAAESLDNLSDLVAAFDQVETAYLDHPDGADARAYDDYLLVARTDEHRLGAESALPDLEVAPPSRESVSLMPADDVQKQLSDPETSVWVAASAGTGKTKVLTDRVLRLLLKGVAADRILCLTFTRAAAAEMAVRIQRSLGAWATLNEPDLATALEGLTGQPPNEETLIRARTLFAATLDTPGGLQIATIHAFCQSLLGRFPLEARVAPHFDLADERTAAELLRDARDRVLSSIARGGDDALTNALGVVAANAAEGTFDSIIQEICGGAGRFDASLAHNGGLDGTLNVIADALGVARDADAEQVLRQAATSGALDEPGLRQAVAAMEAGKTTDKKAAGLIDTWLAGDDDARVAGFADYCLAFLTKEGSPRANLPTKDVVAASPAVARAFANEQARLVGISDQLKAVHVFQRTAAVLRLGHAVLQRFRDNKTRRALLDYDDLINQTNALLAQPDITPWVLYKLDGGIDHVMVDEAQDTSPAQWQIVIELVREFFEGETWDDDIRTLFVVGDEKQSIFSFQGADLDVLRNVHDRLEALATGEQGRWFETGLHRSFRSVSAVLTVVDKVFENARARAGVVDEGATLEHLVQRAGHGGLVELWPVVGDLDDEVPDPWEAPLSYHEPEDRSTRLAREIAATIYSWIERDEMLVAKGRPITAGDIMVLVPRRTRFVHALVRELKQKNVAVAGIDRMDLTGQIAVRDLMVLGYACLMPDDDLALAAVLKGPLADFDDDLLYDLARNRQGWTRDGRGEEPLESLWAALRRRANNDPAFRAAHDWFASQLAHADFERPFEFYSRVLSQSCPAPRGDMVGRRLSGREAMLRRLGIEAEDPLDEFLAASLDYEREHAASLQGYLAWLEAGSAEIKREMEARHDMVRIMTVHGAKGLQAPIVFLVDDMATRPPRTDNLVWLDGGLLPIWPGSAGKRHRLSDEAIDERNARQDEERRRLLYVALTRAEDRLYVTAASSTGESKPDSWHGMVEAGMAEIAEPFDFVAASDPAWTGQALRYQTPQAAPATAKPGKAGGSDVAATLEAELLEFPPVERDTERPVNPSRLGGNDRAPDSPLGRTGGEAAARGRIIHRLLERLPDIAPQRRPDAGQRLLDHLAGDWPAAEKADALASVMAIVDDPAFSALFGPGSRAEVPIIGRVGELVIAGQVDRLIIHDGMVDIVDYKTNRRPPHGAQKAPEAYLRQMAAYRAVLRQIYPDFVVNCLLLWTSGPVMQTLPQDLLDAYAP